MSLKIIKGKGLKYVKLFYILFATAWKGGAGVNDAPTRRINNLNMKRLSLCLLFATLLMTASTDLFAISEVDAPVNVYGRDTLSLNGNWNAFVDQQDMGYYDYRMKPTQWGFFLDVKVKNKSDLVEYNFDDSPTLKVPGDWNTQDDKLFWYEGTMWYRRKFHYTPSEGRRTLLYFGAVNYESRVWVNGKEAGHHVGGFTPFCFDITDAVTDGDNTVIVMVNNNRHKEAVPTQIFDWWNYGGITRDVLIISEPMEYIADYVVQLEKGAKENNLTGKYGNSRRIVSFVKLNVPSAGHQVVVSIPELKIKKTLTTDNNGEARLSFTAKNVSLWNPENPKLYKVRISLDGEDIDDRIGFRTIETQGKKILLNGQPIFLRGVCIHEETAYTNRRCNSAADADTLLAWAKDLGCNFLRLAHYPHYEYAVREAERLGFLVWEELPCYWTIDWTNPVTYSNAQRQLTDMIRRDHNRANIIVWSMANETPHSSERDNFLLSLAKYARTQDSTRLISVAMEVTSAKNYVNKLSDNLAQYVDIISFNQYVGWYRDVNDAPKMTWVIPYDKPVIISEFGGGAVAGRHGDKLQRWTEEFQAELYRQNLAMLDKIDGLAGTTPWVLKDFRSPRRPEPVIQNYFNRKGLVSDQGKRKQAFYVLKEWYRGK